jgi:hypothetical protein
VKRIESIWNRARLARTHWTGKIAACMLSIS